MPVTESQRVHQGEWPAMVLSFVYFFCVLAAYYVIRPVREQLAAAVGSTQLPWFFAATFAATLVLTPVFAWLIARWPRRVVVPVVYLFFMVCLVAFIPLFARDGLISPRALGIVFFVWVSVFNLFVVSVFWSFMADIWDEGQARRLFPLIGVAGTIGAIAGPVITRVLVDVIGVAPLLAVSAGLLGIALLCVLLLGRWSQRHDLGKQHHNQPVGGGIFDGLKQIITTPFMRNMAILMLLGDAVGTICYALVTDYSRATFHDAVARTRFAADLDMSTNLLMILLQLTATRILLPRVGAGVVIAVWAVIGIVVCLAMAMSGNPNVPVFAISQEQAAAWIAHIPDVPFLRNLIAQPIELLPTLSWVVLMLLVTRATAYGMMQPARESLYTLVPRSWRYKGKNAVDTAVWRAGDVASALLVNALKSVGAAGTIFGLTGAAAIAISGWIGWRTAAQAQDARNAARTD
ncbi:MAG: MFS transporter [Proteobacteria bacterium]|nr:MFS transporter [Pseudomonadota bacterium]